MTYANQWLLAAAVAGVSVSCLADEPVGRVISSTPIVQQVSTPQQVCGTQQVAVPQPKSGAGALMGALAGGAIGNQLGRGAGNAAATMLGVMGGAIVGDRIEGSPAPQLQTVQNCVTQSVVQNRTVGYNVVYEYAGQQYTVQMPNDPGPTVALQVSPIGTSNAQAVVAPQPAPVSTVISNPPVYVQPAPVVVASPPVTYYYAQPYYYPPVSVNLGLGWWGHEHHHWH